jgi:hypothetical protein
MVKEYAFTLAEQMGITLSRVAIIDGRLLGCRDSHLVQFHSEGKMESALIYQREIDALLEGVHPERLESRIRTALSRLKEDCAQDGHV